ncbi:hypothetical protein C8R45DRAFT_935593 [Mycena sanguinolenta]|nr:hypothetical protein C8R45DRAFT_935593 [Mycena sanguinolenta]
MSSRRLWAESRTAVQTPLQQRSHSDAHATRTEYKPDTGVKSGGNDWRTVNNYISGGQGGSGGGGLQGGAGGVGEGLNLQYNIKAERVVMKTVIGSETTPADCFRIPLANIDLRSEIQVDAVTGAVWLRSERNETSIRRMYSARVIGHNEPMTVALYQGHNAEEVRNFYDRFNFDI